MRTVLNEQRIQKIRGLTLVELLVAMSASAIVIMGLSMLIRNMLNSYHFQDIKTEMMQNAHFTAERISEVLAETGACLPVRSDMILQSTVTGNRTSFTRKENPACAVHRVTAPYTGRKIWVDTNGLAFSKVKWMIAEFIDGAEVNHIRWSEEIVSVSIVDKSLRADTVLIANDQTLVKLDMLYGYNIETWDVTPNGSLYIYTDDATDTTMTIAENIDTLLIEFDFTDITGTVITTTNDWFQMRNGTITVVARTERPDPFTREYQRVTLKSRFRFKSVY